MKDIFETNDKYTYCREEDRIGRRGMRSGRLDWRTGARPCSPVGTDSTIQAMTAPDESGRQLSRRAAEDSAAAAVTGATGPVAARHASDGDTESFVLTTRATRSGEYLYLPFGVPEGVHRVDIDLSKSGDTSTSVGLGPFDHRGPQYQSDGFRAVCGAERDSCYVTATDATQSFLPRPVEPGIRTMLVPVFERRTPATIAVTVTLTYGRERRGSRPVDRPVPPRSPETGWYAGNLHCHTPASSDAWASGSALSPSGRAETAASLGLNYVSLTDHDVTKQNRKRRRAMRKQGGDVLPLGGEELTNWFHGHTTVTELDGASGSTTIEGGRFTSSW